MLRLQPGRSLKGSSPGRCGSLGWFSWAALREIVGGRLRRSGRMRWRFQPRHSVRKPLAECSPFPIWFLSPPTKSIAIRFSSWRQASLSTPVHLDHPGKEKGPSALWTIGDRLLLRDQLSILVMLVSLSFLFFFFLRRLSTLEWPSIFTIHPIFLLSILSISSLFLRTPFFALLCPFVFFGVSRAQKRSGRIDGGRGVVLVLRAIWCRHEERGRASWPIRGAWAWGNNARPPGGTFPPG